MNALSAFFMDLIIETGKNERTHGLKLATGIDLYLFEL